MEDEGRATSVNRSEKTFGHDTERTVAVPRFDEKSVRRARPAIPLRESAPRRSWPLALIVLCVAAGLAGGMAGGVIATLFHKGAQNSAPAPSGASIVRSEAVGARGARETSEPGSAAENSAGRQAPLTGDAPATPGAQPESRPRGEQAVSAHESSTSSTAARAADGVDERSGERESSDEGERRARQPAPVAAAPPVGEDGEASEQDGAGDGPADGQARASLRGALDEWVAATNARDIQKQMSFYDRKINAFYLSRNASREDVRAEKTRVFARADVVDVRAGAPDIKLSRDGRTATMRFRKKYVIEGGGQGRRGEVLQELRWQRTGDGWRIVGERDLRVIN